MKNINEVKKESNINNKLRSSFEEAKKDFEFKEMIDKINLPEDELMKYTSSIEDSVKEYKNCKMCKSILACKNNMHGFCYLPKVVDNKLLLIPCVIT